MVVHSASNNTLSYGLNINVMQENFAAFLKGDVKIEKTNPITISAPTNFQTIDELMQSFGMLAGSGAQGLTQ